MAAADVPARLPSSPGAPGKGCALCPGWGYGSPNSLATRVSSHQGHVRLSALRWGPTSGRPAPGCRFTQLPSLPEAATHWGTAAGGPRGCYLEGDGFVGLGGHQEVLPAPVRRLDPLLVGGHKAVAGHDALGDLGVVDLGGGGGQVAAPPFKGPPPAPSRAPAAPTWKRRLCWPISVSLCLVTATHEGYQVQASSCSRRLGDHGCGQTPPANGRAGRWGPSSGW